jgi:uncharacterized protein YciI
MMKAMSRWLLLSLMALATAHGETYCFGFLNSHPERKQIPEAQAEEIQKGHLAHMGRMGLAGHLLVAGPLLTPGGPRGIVLYRCASIEEAREWTSHDPAVQNKRLVLEVYRWHGPDGLGEPLASRLKADPNTKYEMVQFPLILLRKTDKWEGSGPGPVLREHGKRIAELSRQGTIRAAGPFVDAEDRVGLVPGVVGVLVLSAMSLDEAKALAAKDPLVREGYATADSYIWMVADGTMPKP